MLNGYAMHGHGEEALTHFEQMCQKDFEINNVTFVCLLSARSRAGLVDEGLCYFESMGSVYGLPATVEHNSCMVGLLGRAGNLHEAEDIIKGMSCQPKLCGQPYSVLAEFMVTWSWENALLNKFLKGNLEMLEAMCCYQTSMLLLASGDLSECVQLQRKGKGCEDTARSHLD
jgi:pentatricopeptide repeat protein